MRTLIATLLLATGAFAAEPPLTVYLAPNTHGTVAGWLVDFDSERSHVVNNYLSHMDRVASDPTYAMAFSEVPNLMVLMQFTPERMAQLKQQVKEGRLELVNGFFLEPTVNLSGGEALVQMGVLGLRWYDQMFGRRPRFSWMIDVCGTHRQMPQIVNGLGLEALFFSRNNPAPQSVFRWNSPDGSSTLAVCLGRGYASTSRMFKTEGPLTDAEMNGMHEFFEQDRQFSSSKTSIFVPVGGGDYSLAPKRSGYPKELIDAWRAKYPGITLRFAVPGAFVDQIQKEVRAGSTRLPEYAGDTVHSYNAFWMNMPEIKRRYRAAEHTLQASEMLAAIASLKGKAEYPATGFYHDWIQMLLNMDRNVLWGAGAGDPFDSPTHWNVADRFAWVERHAGGSLTASLNTLSREGQAITLFNPLNWDRQDPVELTVPKGTRPAGLPCEAHPGRLLCRVPQPSAGVTSVPLENGVAPAPEEQPFAERIETRFYVVKLDRATGAIVSLRDRASGKEFLSGAANVVQAESVAGIVRDPSNWMAQRPKRKLVATSSSFAPQWRCTRGAVATTLVARSGFIGTSTLERRITLYQDDPRIDFETTVDLHSPDTLVTVDFPLAGPVVERTRGIPYGFATVDPRHVTRPLDYFLGGDQKLYGFSDAIAPNVRWSDYALEGGGGVALLDRGLTCHELNGDTVTLALVNAQSSYRGHKNDLLAGQGRRTFSYALLPHRGTFQQAAVPRRAMEFNSPVFAGPGRSVGDTVRYLETSDNVIVEAVRRVGGDIEIRLVEAVGARGEATLTLRLPHSDARLTNLMGEQARKIAGSGGKYRFAVKPQEIVTLRFRAPSAVPVPPAIRAWDELVPAAKRAALHQHLDLKGYPGGQPWH